MYSLLFTSVLALLPSPLIDKLGDKSFKQREIAHNNLSKFGRLALPILECTYKKTANIEIKRRCYNLLAPYSEEIAEREALKIRPTNWPRIPWFDINWQTEFGGNQAWKYIEEARKRPNLNKDDLGPPDWWYYREATRIWIKSQLIQRRPLEEIIRALDYFATEERGWIQQHGDEYKPPITLPKGY